MCWSRSHIVGAGNAPGEPWFTWEMNVLSRMEHGVNIRGRPLYRPKVARDCGIVNRIMLEFYCEFLKSVTKSSFDLACAQQSFITVELFMFHEVNSSLNFKLEARLKVRNYYYYYRIRRK